jgi:hypothetical protein
MLIMIRKIENGWSVYTVVQEWYCKNKAEALAKVKELMG